MTYAAKFSLTTAIATGILTFAFTSGAFADAPIVVHLNDGTQYTAEVSERTDGTHLWLAFRTRSTEYLRPIVWERIADGKWQGQSLGSHELRERVLDKPASDDTHKSESPKPEPALEDKANRTLASEALDLLFSPATERNK